MPTEAVSKAVLHNLYEHELINKVCEAYNQAAAKDEVLDLWPWILVDCLGLIEAPRSHQPNALIVQVENCVVLLQESGAKYPLGSRGSRWNSIQFELTCEAHF